jgi:hypothetical protein
MEVARLNSLSVRTCKNSFDFKWKVPSKSHLVRISPQEEKKQNTHGKELYCRSVNWRVIMEVLDENPAINITHYIPTIRGGRKIAFNELAI